VKYVFMKLVPPRTDFMQTMTSDELDLMRQHQSYWAGFAEKGWAVAYGPVADPVGAESCAGMPVLFQNRHERTATRPKSPEGEIAMMLGFAAIAKSGLFHAFFQGQKFQGTGSGGVRPGGFTGGRYDSAGSGG